MSLTTGQITEEAGVKKETILYYEREGLIDEPLRTNNGYRQFRPDEAVLEMSGTLLVVSRTERYKCQSEPSVQRVSRSRKTNKT